MLRSPHPTSFPAPRIPSTPTKLSYSHTHTLVATRAGQSSIHLFVCTKTKFPTPGCNAIVAIRLSEERFSGSLRVRQKMDACSYEEFREAQTAMAKNLAHLAFGRRQSAIFLSFTEFSTLPPRPQRVASRYPCQELHNRCHLFCFAPSALSNPPPWWHSSLLLALSSLSLSSVAAPSQKRKRGEGSSANLQRAPQNHHFTRYENGSDSSTALHQWARAAIMA